MSKKTLWGSASAAYQIEGAYKEDGKSLSIWDNYVRIPGKTYKGTNGDVACDHYHRYKEDVKLMKEMGLQIYRFSIAWTRILPNGRGEVNQKGIDFYNNLIDELIANGIEPAITIYHWDLPQCLQDEYGGWASRKIIDDFTNYASVIFENFADRVKKFIVMNEPAIFINLAYLLDLHPPCDKDPVKALNGYHHTALCHAKVVNLYKEKGYDGIIGSSIAFGPTYPASDDPKDIEANKNHNDLHVWWEMDIYFKGEYPKYGLDYYQKKFNAPVIEDGDYELLKSAAKKNDFIGINYYQTAVIAYNPEDGVGSEGGKMNNDGKKGQFVERGIPGIYKSIKNNNVEYTDWDWAIDPDGIRYGMVQLKERYGQPIFISENGLGAFDKLEADGSINDDYRIKFISDHIDAIKQATKEGVDVLAYCTWSFTDLLSWLNGYQKRYGFVHIDFDSKDLTRRKKKSYHWYKDFIKNNG